jgi:hypothetical protein
LASAEADTTVGKIKARKRCGLSGIEMPARDSPEQLDLTSQPNKGLASREDDDEIAFACRYIVKQHHRRGQGIRYFVGQDKTGTS